MDNPSNDAVEPIAVVGMGCRFPGTATSPSRLWQMLHNGESAWSGIPQSRMNVASYFHPNRNRQGTIPFQAAHFLQEDVAAFDSSFFSIPADEAKAIDPQQRMLLEVAVEALDSAGIDRAAIRKSETGVWIGSFVKDYEQVVLRDPDNAPKYGATGNGIAIMSNRISFFLDVNGPSMTIDTGCSASLVCLHNACQALRDHEIDMGLTGGAGMILSPNTMLPMTALNFLSPDGKCYTFDARANGYGRGEGIGIVVLKRLQDAIRDNDNIRAVIRGSRVNQDGRTPGITLPSARAQLRNIKSLYEKAGIPVQSTAYVECHGTGTQAGDWRELRAVSSAFCEQRTSDNPIYVGSVKTNIGHLEGCAGIAGVIKGILTIENGVIPKHLNFEAPGNPAIDFDGWKIKVPIANTPWPVDGLRRASINCFGFGGTNAHVILDDAAHYLSERRLLAHHNTIGVKDAQGSSALPACEGDKSAFADTMRDLVGPTQGGQIPSRDSTTHLFVFSAHEQKVLSKMVQDYASHVGALGDAATGNIMEDLAYTLGCRRTKLAWKASVAARSPQDLVAKLQELQPTDFIRTSEDKATKVAFVFGGQGAQWFAMGRELLGFDIFLQSILEATLYMQTHLESSFSLLMELLRDEDSSRINQPEVSQPATTAIQVALVDLLTTFFGISPNSVCGHSSGEIAAAYAMGAISREDAWQLAFYRGHCAGAMHASEGKDFPKGSMLAVGLSAPEAQKYVDLVGNKRAVVACINSPASVTLSGDSEAIRELHEYFQAARIFSRLLVVSIAYHSHHMKRCVTAYLRSIAHIVPREPTCKAVPHPHNQGKLVTPSDICLGDRLLDLPPSSETPAMYSSVTGHAISWEKLGPEYWVANMVCPVLFSEAMHQMVNSEGDEKPSIVFELSPHSSLQGPIKQILDREEKLRQPPAYFSALRRSKDAAITTLEAVGKLWGHGCDISMPWVVMRNVQTGRPKLLVDLPKYPWNHDKVYWYESHLSRANRFQVHGRYDLIGRPTLDSNPFYPRWRGFFRVSENPWIRDHQVQKTMIYPAAGMVAMVLEAAKQMASEGASGFEITRFKILKAMLIPSTSHGLEYVLNFNKHDSQKATSSARRAQSSSSAAPSTAFGFSISTKQLDGPWEEHGSGFVTILYRQSTEGARAEHQALQGSLAHTESRYNAYHNARVNCDEVVIPRQLYETLDVIGMNYGPLFQNIASLHKRDNACASIIRIPDTKSGMPASFEYPHIVHPATLDSIFQTAFALSSDPMVPSFLGSLYVSAESHKLSRSGEQLATYTRAERRGVRDASASFVVSDDSWLRPHGPRASPLIIVKDLHFTALTPNPASIANMFLPNHRNLCSEIVWEALDDSSSSMEEQEPAKDTENPLERLKGVLIDVLILIPEDVSPGINRLCDEFADIPCMGRQFRTLRSIGDDEILPEICISLIEADGQAMIWSWSEQEFIAFRNILTSVKGMFWITRGSQLEARNPRSSLVQALGRTIHSEYPKKKVVTFDIDVGNDFTDAEAEPLSRIVLRLFGKALGPESTKPVETEYIERNGQIMVPRLVLVKPLNSMIERGSAPAEPELLPMPAPHERPLKLEIGQLGQTDTFYWYDDPDASRPVLPDEVKVRVALTTLSDLDNDVLRGRAHSGLIGTDMYGVVEQTGKNVTNVTVGDHVVGIARGSLGDYIKCHHRLVYKVTENPIINPCQLTGFSIARYAIEGLKAGETILVHAGASIFGQAAIQLAKSVGATIFATAKTNRQRGTLSHYWEIPEDHILDARRDGLVDAILRLTDNNGVDVIYDTTARSRDSNLSCIREGGRIVGFANKPDKNKMTAHQGNVSGKTFSCTIIDVPHLIKHQSHKLGDALTFVCPRVMSGDFGVWRPNTQVYKYSDLTAAFTELAADKAGALIYCQRPASEPVPIIPQSPRPTSDSLRADATYVLSGGLGGLGVEIAKLLAANGVKNIVFLSRSGTASALVESGLEGLRSGGTNVRIYKVDICDRNALSRVSGVIEQCMPPVKGVFQCAAVLRDSVFENMTYEDWKLATKPKTEGSWNLYQIFGNGPDFFVFLSSTAGVIGNRGQPNYAAGNAFQDSLARHINTTSNGGTRAVSIDLGPILGAGMLAEDPQMLDKLKASGFFGIRLQDFKRVVECAITGYTEGGQTMPAQVVTGVGTGGLTRQNKPADPYWTRTAMFTHLNREDMPETDLDDSSESQDTMRKLLARTVDKEEARCIIVEGLREMLSKSMNMHASDVDESKPPSAYGVDSLVAVGVRSWVFRECEVDVSIFEVLSEISIGELSAMIVQRRAVV
ncbi:ketoacyl-synt-domain-containing protein [Hypoxylon crocopeplum]|nr:ketoacyl-synt-domain-containing protein [Hypoxylon crocopeplum]